MSTKGSDDALVQAAVGILLTSPNLNVPQAMRAANFSGNQSYDQALRARVRRLHRKKLSTEKQASSPPPFSIHASSVSAASLTPTAGSTAPQAVEHPRPIPKQQRKTTTQSQQTRSNDKQSIN
mmetsp:Transcript_24214/g.44509  ORF Transcript_24214/g.44509 Transcript_24214/m.44509 type:complete len:123 (+) Transcript_24214:54-422(+)